MKKEENKERNGVKEAKEVEVKKMRKKPDKQVLIFTGIFLVTLGTFF